MTADVRNVLAVPASRLRAFTSSPALTAAYLGNVRRAPRFAGSPRLRRRRPAACPPVVLRLHRPRLQSPLSASCPPRTLSDDLGSDGSESDHDSGSEGGRDLY